MYGVYLCGCTDCFLTAMFQEQVEAIKWAEENSKNPEGFVIKYFAVPDEISLDDWLRN